MEKIKQRLTTDYMNNSYDPEAAKLRLYENMLSGKVPATPAEKNRAHRMLHALGVALDCDNCDSNSSVCDR